MALSIEVLLLAGLASDKAHAQQMLRQRLDDGSALARFGAMVTALGGPTDLLGTPERRLETAPYIMSVNAESSGYIAKVDAFAVGLAMVDLGAGRKLPTDNIDHGVGLSGMAHVGDAITTGDPLCLIHARDAAAFETAAVAVRRAITITTHRPAANAVVVGRMSTIDPET
jgi:thymidine phosphorylase